MPILNWICKDKIINHHLDVPYHVLQRQYSFDCDGQHAEDNGSENMIIHGDNLLALKSLLPQYEGCINCVYIDPPYNTGEDWIYNDNVNDPRITVWLNKVVGSEGEDLSRHDKWLCMMYPRLKLLQRLLADDGIIFISIDDNEQANLKKICDEIFGTNNFITTLVWKSRAKPSNVKGQARYKPQNDAEYILCYKKHSDPQFIRVFSGNDRNYPYSDEEGNYRLQGILKSNEGNSRRETMCFSLDGYTPPPTKRWQASEETIRDLWQRNRIMFVNGVPKQKCYEKEEDPEHSPFWCYIPTEISGTAEGGKTTLNKILGPSHGFDTVKPIPLIEYLLQHSVPKDGIILDSFAGSGTTAHAVLNLNKKDGGKRRFILIEMLEYAETLTSERIKRVIKGYASNLEQTIYDCEINTKNLSNGADFLDEAKETRKLALDGGKYTKITQPTFEDGHLRVIGTLATNYFEEGIGGNFSYYDLGATIMENGSLNEDVGVDKIREYVFFTETKTRPEPVNEDNPFFLGMHTGTAYFFYYNRDNVTVLNREFLHSIKIKAVAYVIYADICYMSEAELEGYNITFKKIPRDISKL